MFSDWIQFGLLAGCSILSEHTHFWTGWWEVRKARQVCWRDEPASCRAVVVKNMLAVLLWTMSSTLSMTKCQCNGAPSVCGSFHSGVPWSTSGVCLTAVHNNTPFPPHHKPLALTLPLSTSTQSVIYSSGLHKHRHRGSSDPIVWSHYSRLSLFHCCFWLYLQNHLRVHKVIHCSLFFCFSIIP